jgi:hypothetical protein
MESEIMASEEKLVRNVNLDWINHLHGSATSPMRHLFTLINLTLML